MDEVQVLPVEVLTPVEVSVIQPVEPISEQKREFLEHLAEHNAFPRKSSSKTCNGKIHRQFRYCKKQAGWGTTHFGKGRCKLHGGCCTGVKSGKLRYSDFVPTDIVEKYEEFSVEDKVEILSLDSEIGLIRAKLTDLVNRNQSGIFNKDLLQFTELLRRLVETKQKMEEGITRKVTIEITMKLVEKVIEVIDKNIPDVLLKQRIAGDLRRLNEADLGLMSLN